MAHSSTADPNQQFFVIPLNVDILWRLYGRLGLLDGGTREDKEKVLLAALLQI
jgi:hypothetical protein